MEDHSRNICRIGRQAAGMTQERWAEAIGCSVEAIRGYERGEYMPSDDLALRMADAAGLPVLSHWHLLNKSFLARELLPDVRVVPLSVAALRAILAIKRFVDAHQSDRLLEIAEDGRVDELEKMDFQRILIELQGITAAAAALRYAREEGF
jgi:transcriptional regulator with XRE-family HTH domain